MAKEQQFMRALGWLSLGLGAIALAEPRKVARMIGAPDNDSSRQALLSAGLREIVCGIGLLAEREPTGWVWARVGGDMMDLSLLGAALRSETSDRNRLTMATAVIAGITAVDLYYSQQAGQFSQQANQSWEERNDGSQRNGSAATRRPNGMREIYKSITINAAPDELYHFWHDFENLPLFMKHLDSVKVTGDGRSHWKAKAPAGTTVEWDAEVVTDVPGELIAWRSLENAQVENAGEVRFVPATGGRGTQVQVRLRYDAPGGPIGVMIAKLFGEEPDIQVQEDLRRFKQIMETGDIVVSDGSIWRADRLLFSGERPAQPVPEMAARP